MGTKRQSVIRRRGHARRVKVVGCVNHGTQGNQMDSCNDGLGISWVIYDGTKDLPGIGDVP